MSIEEIARLEERRWKAALESDVETLTELYSPDLAYIHSNGWVDNREQYFATLTSGRVRYTAAPLSDVQMRDHGDVVVITGRVDMEYLALGQHFIQPMRFSAVWARANDRWQLVSWHASTSLAPRTAR